MSRIHATFEALKAAHRKALIPYITVGDPYADATVEIMLAMAAAGADVIELGVPFSDPMADGPVIQQASERALARGIGMAQVLDAVAQFRRANATTPVVLMGYANPVERYDQRHGAGAFVADCAEAGVDGVLVVDYPPEECQDFARAFTIVCEPLTLWPVHDGRQKKSAPDRSATVPMSLSPRPDRLTSRC